MIPLTCRVCGTSRDTFPERTDPQGTCLIISRCFECGQLAGHDPVVVEYLDCAFKTIGRSP